MTARGGGNAATIDLPAGKAEVFGLLADVEQLPRWAPELFHRIEIGRDGWLAYTPMGELKVELTAEPHTGMIKLQVRFGRGRTAVFLLWLQSRREDLRVRVIALDTERMGPGDASAREFYTMLLAATTGWRLIFCPTWWQSTGRRAHRCDVAA